MPAGITNRSRFSTQRFLEAGSAGEAGLSLALLFPERATDHPRVNQWL